MEGQTHGQPKTISLHLRQEIIAILNIHHWDLIDVVLTLYLSVVGGYQFLFMMIWRFSVVFLLVLTLC